VTAAATECPPLRIAVGMRSPRVTARVAATSAGVAHRTTAAGRTCYARAPSRAWRADSLSAEPGWTTSPSIARCSAPQSVVMAAPYRRRPTDALWPTLRLVGRCVGVNWRTQGGDLGKGLLCPFRWLGALALGGHAREVAPEPGWRTDDQLMIRCTAEVGVGAVRQRGRRLAAPRSLCSTHHEAGR
jgi:hypothetical protein